MVKKLTTIDLKGKSYATVPTRIKEFREACPNGLIEPTPTFMQDGKVMFSVRVLKDKSDKNSGEAVGHAIGELTGDKSFEKLETIATGRALALLGYMASGEVASSEEMEEFNEYKNTKEVAVVDEFRVLLTNTKSLEEMKALWPKLPAKVKVQLKDLKDELRKKYDNTKN